MAEIFINRKILQEIYPDSYAINRKIYDHVHHVCDKYLVLKKNHVLLQRLIHRLVKK